MSIPGQVASVILVLFVTCPLMADEKRHLQLAEECLELGGYRKQLETMHKDAAENLAGSNPDLSSHQAAIERAHGRVFSYAKLKPILAQNMIKAFTEDDLVELIKFYKTPIGKKLIEKSPDIAKNYAEAFKKLAEG